MSFTLQIAQFAKGTQEKIQRIRRGVTFELFRAVVMDTPVLTGRLRGNWMLGEGEPDLDVDLDYEDKEGTATLADLKRVIDTTDGNKAIFLSNSLPYAARIEFDGWSHTKAPEGMVRRNVARFNRIVEAATGKERSKRTITARPRDAKGRFLKTK